MKMEPIRIDAAGKASDMSFESVMSPDGCNPVSKDEEVRTAHAIHDPFWPAVYPATLPGSIPGTYNNTIVPAYFPGQVLNPSLK